MDKVVQKHCLIYCRVSSAKQAQQGESIEDQEKICRSIADKYNADILDVFKEQYSGRKDERPVIDEIFSYIKKHPNKVSFLIFRAIDRFTRNGTLGYESLKQKLAQYGVELIDSYGIIQPSKNTLEHLGVEYNWSRIHPSEITELVMAQQGKSEVSQILTRMIGAEINLVRDGYKVRQENDGYINEKIYVDNGKKRVIQIPDTQRAHFFIKMFEMSITHTDQQVVDYVNAMGYKSKETKRWSKGKDRIVGTRGGIKLTVKQLQKIRQRPIYAGINAEKWLETPIKTQYKGLVSIDMFNKANKGKVYIKEDKDGLITILKDYNPHQLKRMKDNPEFPHKAVVLCSVCKKPFLGSSPKGKYKAIPTYHCAREHKYLGINKVEFEKQLTDFVSKLEYKDEAFIKTFEAVLMNKFREREKELGEFSVQVGTTVIELETEKKTLIEAYTSTKNEIIRDELEKKINEIHQQIEITREQRNGIEVQESDIHAFVGYVKNLMEHPVEMLVKQKDLTALKGLFSVVFDELPTYQEIVNGTPKLSIPYKLKEEFKVNKDLSVNPLRGFQNYQNKEVTSV